MRRILLIATFLSAATLPLLAQMRGVARSVTSVGPRGFSGSHFGPRQSVTSLGPRGFPGGMGFHGGVVIVHPRPKVFARPVLFNNGVFFRHRFPFYGYGYYGYYPYYPYGHADYDYSAGDTSPAQDNSALYAEIQGLRQDIAELKEAQASRAAEQYEAQRPQARPESASAPTYPPVAFVFRDGHQLDARNYAIVGYNFWIMDDGRTRRYPLSQLDLQATTRVNEERGVPFQLPGH